ncbi:MAG: hypothetical protein AAF485_31155, partial [Chloroflexota bacterium]
MAKTNRLFSYFFIVKALILLLIGLTACNNVSTPLATTSSQNNRVFTPTPLIATPETERIAPSPTLLPKSSNTPTSSPPLTPTPTQILETVELPSPTASPAIKSSNTPTPSPSPTPAQILEATDLPCPYWEWTMSGKIYPDWPKHTFKIAGMACDSLVEGHRIEIFQADETHPAQVIEEHFLANKLYNRDEGFEIVDMNFDGYQDIRLIDEITAGTGGVSYRHWLFDPQTEAFVAEETMNQHIGYAEFDAAQNEIRTYWRNGAAGHLINYYQWIDDELTFIKREDIQSITNDAQQVIVTT